MRIIIGNIYINKLVDSLCPNCRTFLYFTMVDYESNYEEGLYYRCKNRRKLRL